MASGKPNWSNIAFGIRSGNTLTLSWADVPKGGASGNGQLKLKVNSASEIVRTAVTGGFGGSKWTRSSSPVFIDPNLVNPGILLNTTLSAPTQVSPACGSVFNNYPRTTTFKWKAVNGAKSYTIEIDCYGCCKSGKWCSDVGKTFKVEKGLTSTTYTYNFVGAQPGRWRVWAVDANGKEGTKSAWCDFKYTR